MDDRNKRIEVNASSLVDLKAELLRKQEELRQQKLNSASTYIRAQAAVKKPSVWSKKNVGVLERAQRDVEQKNEETDALERAKLALEAKAKIYEQMTQGDTVPDEDGSKLFLVDFEQKSLKILAEKRKAQKLKLEQEKEEQMKEEIEERKALEEVVPLAKNPEDEWVDYVDSFGRSRKCLRKDLPDFVAVGPNASNTGRSAKPNLADSRDLMSADMQRELQRQQWEKEAEEALAQPVGPLHYADIRFNEVRDHGVGFFEFSKDEATRQEQLEALKKLRKQTEEQRVKSERLKEKRKALMQARLAKVKQRKTIQESLDLDPLASLEDDANVIGPLPAEAEVVPEPLVRDEAARKTGAVREWDRGKKPVYDEQSWFAERRDERVSEFAPPKLYADDTAKSLRMNNIQTTKKTPFKTVTETAPVETPDPGSIADSIGATLHAIRTEVAGTTSERPANAEVCQPSTDLQNTFSADACPPVPGYAMMPPAMVNNPGFGPPFWQYPPMDAYQTWAAAYAYQMYNHDSLPSHPYPDPPVIAEAGVTYPCDAPAVAEAGVTYPSVSASYSAPESAVSSVATTVITSAGTLSGMASSSTSMPAPQPAHFSAPPSVPQPKMAKYERVFVHELPPTLPLPPTVGGAPTQYPSQEEVFGPNRRKEPRQLNEKEAVRNWFRQFDQRQPAQRHQQTTVDKLDSDGGVEPLRPKHIPFASPYIQTADTSANTEDKTAAEFDPSVPPPQLETADVAKSDGTS